MEAADFSAPMAARSSGTDSSSLSAKVASPTWMRRGTVSNRTVSLWKEAARRSQLLSLTMFHVISCTPNLILKIIFYIIIPEGDGNVKGKQLDRTVSVC